jgi:hypothetical protein
VRVTGSLDYTRNGHGRMQVSGRVRGTMTYRAATGWTGRFYGRHLVEHRRAQKG